MFQENELNGLETSTVNCLQRIGSSSILIGENGGVKILRNNIIEPVQLPKELYGKACRSIIQVEKQVWMGFWDGGLYKCNLNFQQFEKIERVENQKVRKIYSWGNAIYVGTDDGCWKVNMTTSEVEKVCFELKRFESKNTITDFFEYNGHFYISTFRNGIYQLDSNSKNPAIWLNQGFERIFSAHVVDSSLFLSHGSKYSINSFKEIEVNGGPTNSFSGSIYWDFAKTPTGVIAASDGVNRLNGGLYKLTDSLPPVLLNKQVNLTDREILCLDYDAESELLYVGTKSSGLVIYHIAVNQKLVELKDEPCLDILLTDHINCLVYPTSVQLEKNGIHKTITQTDLWPIVESNDFAQYSGRPTFNQFTFNTVESFKGTLYLGSSLGMFSISDQGSQLIHNIRSNKILADGSISYSWGTYTHLMTNSASGWTELLTNDGSYLDVVGMHQVEEKTVLVDKNNWIYQIENRELKQLNKDYSELLSPVNSTAIFNQKVITVHQGGTIISTSLTSPYLVDTIELHRIHENEKSLLVTSNASNYFLITQYGIHFYGVSGWEQFQPFNWALSPRIVETVGANADELFVSFKNEIISYKLHTKEPEIQREISAWYKVGNLSSDFVKSSFPIILKIGEQLNIKVASESILLNPLYRTHVTYSVSDSTFTTTIANNKEITIPNLSEGDWTISVSQESLKTGDIRYIGSINVSVRQPIYLTWPFFALMGLVLIGALIIFYQIFERKRTRKQIKNLEGKQRVDKLKLAAITGQMNPHFVFNSMNSIQNLILKNDNDTALRYMGDFGKILRHSVDQVNRETVSLKSELTFINAYVHLESLRFSKPVKFDLKVEMTETELATIHLPAMLIQPLIENAFKHAFNNIEKPELNLNVFKEDGNLILKLQDNGVGFNPDHVDKTKSKGLWLVEERLKLYNEDSDILLANSNGYHTVSLALHIIH